VSDTERGASTVRRLTFQSDGLTLADDEPAPAGPARGWVLLLHGGGQTRHSWARTGGLLAGAGWRSIATDARGRGDSGWDPASDYTTAAMARDIQAVARETNAGHMVTGDDKDMFSRHVLEFLADLPPSPSPNGEELR
jgi:pimeloyl-ACP methyl ester carboxylesterase